MAMATNCSFSKACVFPGPVNRLPGSPLELCQVHRGQVVAASLYRTAHGGVQSHPIRLSGARGTARRSAFLDGIRG